MLLLHLIVILKYVPGSDCPTDLGGDRTNKSQGSVSLPSEPGKRADGLYRGDMGAEVLACTERGVERLAGGTVLPGALPGVCTLWSGTTPRMLLLCVSLAPLKSCRSHCASFYPGRCCVRWFSAMQDRHGLSLRPTQDTPPCTLPCNMSRGTRMTPALYSKRIITGNAPSIVIVCSLGEEGRGEGGGGGGTCTPDLQRRPHHQQRP